jgi:hypothetical protein
MKRTLALLLALLPCLTFGQSMAAYHGAAGAVAQWDRWWLPSGLVEANCVAAYAPKGAQSQAASYINLANNAGLYTAAPGDAPSWASSTGWWFNGTNDYLTTGISPRYTQTWSMIIKANGGRLLTTGQNLAGVGYSGAQRFVINATWSATQCEFSNGGAVGYKQFTPRFQAGIMAIAGRNCYRDGSYLGQVNLSSDATERTAAMFIGALNANGGTISGRWQGYMTSIAIYRVILTPAQVVEIGAKMP